MEAVIARVLDRHLAERPDAPAVIARGGALTYAGLDAAAGAAAGALWELGVRPGMRVAACLPNDLDIVTAFHGAQRIGAVWAGIGEALAPAEQAALAAMIEPTVILAGPRCGIEADNSKKSRVLDTRAWRVLTARNLTAPPVTADPHAPAGIAFTSGTTGAPKAITHSQHNLLLPARVLAATRGYGPDLRKGDSFPLTILNLQVLCTLLAAVSGGTAVVMDRRDPDGVAEWIQRSRATVWNGAPAQLHDLAARPDLDLSALSEAWTGGGDTPEHVRAAFTAAHRIPVVVSYGLSEAPTCVSIDPPDGRHREGASGRVLEHLDVTAEEGELIVRAAQDGPWKKQWRPPLGLWRDGHVTGGGDQVATGDIGTVDAGGWLTVTDRKKLMIVRGGGNVSPAEVERVLTAHPAVRRAAVFGVPDDRLGERVAALIVPGTGVTEEALAEFCARRLARYKIPDRWGAAAELPVNAMNKVIRPALPDLLGSAPPLQK
ncbi:MAG: acyl--CoA ligase [Streptosporangiales bacterium]|nr:acyl--CoA ligase [Streptosporangiales bacterium]